MFFYLSDVQILSDNAVKQYHIHIQGLVQGVKLRPLIYRIATSMQLNGIVEYRNDGVIVRINTSEKNKKNFINEIYRLLPVVSSINNISVTEYPVNDSFTNFKIEASHSVSSTVTQISPDIATCNECMADTKVNDHRYRYPFINCTHCGPRFSIIHDLPYDRSATTMHEFKMCNDCRDEFQDINDRRFHAQPIACNNCGPKYYIKEENSFRSDYDYILHKIGRLIDQDGIIAMKGTGGFNLICDASSHKAVERLRKIKSRESKPFAVMFRSLQSVKQYCELNEQHESALFSWRRPVVLLPLKTAFYQNVNNGLTNIGVILPYLPIHIHLFEIIKSDILVFTSGNISEEPIIIDNDEALALFSDLTDCVVCNNRPIYNRVDDSVVHLSAGIPQVIRRARGYVPEPFFTNYKTEGILAFGAENNNVFAIGKNNQFIFSQHIGDLKNSETNNFYLDSITRFEHIFKFKPKLLVSDMHPDYFSTQAAEQRMSAESLPLLKVQHHYAHAVSCMYENNIAGKALAITFDGTGYGPDGCMWGGEILLCDYLSYERLSHIEYVAMPGGDAAAKESWRMLLAYIFHYFNDYSVLPDDFMFRIDEKKIGIILQMIDKKINSPLTSSAGRLFDAVASLLNICDKQRYQAEAPMLLENIASNDYVQHYTIENQTTMKFGKMIEEIIYDLKQKQPVSLISAKFHNTIVMSLYQKINQLSDDYQIKNVVLSGGVFQNRRLSGHLAELFRNSPIQLYQHRNIPCNDAGIAAGQIIIASHLINY